MNINELKNSRIDYDSQADILSATLEHRDDDLRLLNPVDGYVTLGVSSTCGALCTIEILNVKFMIGNPSMIAEGLEYEEEEDTLYIHFTEEDGELPWCDNAYQDEDFNMISLNRNSFGNLTGIEIIGISRLIDKYS